MKNQKLKLIPGMSFEVELNEETGNPVIAWRFGSNGGYSANFSDAINDAQLTGRGEGETPSAARQYLAALETIELRMTQAILASSIGRKRNRTEFLIGELERMKSHARAAIGPA